MLQSGRKPQTSKLASGVQDLDWPPDPPAQLNSLAQQEWCAALRNLNSDAMPRQSLPLLAVWCAIKTDLDQVMMTLAAFAPGLPTQSNDEFKRYNRLMRVRGSLAGQLGTLSTKLRLTPQPCADAHKQGAGGGKPWTEPELRATSPSSAVKNYRTAG